MHGTNTIKRNKNIEAKQNSDLAKPANKKDINELKGEKEK